MTNSHPGSFYPKEVTPIYTIMKKKQKQKQKPKLINQ